MINYPIKKKTTNIKVSSSSNRGMDLEQALNETNEYYLNNDIAVIYKKPIPIQIVKVDYPSRDKAKISEAYYKIPSTTDYNGIFQNKYIDFEAKECHNKTAFPLANIHEHQVEFMRNYEKQDGVAFVLISYTHRNQFYYMRFRELFGFWNRMLEGGRKSFRYEELDERFFLKETPGVFIPYLDTLQKDLDYRD